MVPNFNSVNRVTSQSNEYSDEQYEADIDDLFRIFDENRKETLTALGNNPLNQPTTEAAHSPSDTNDSDSDKENDEPGPKLKVVPGTLFAQPTYKEPPKTSISAAPNIPVLRRTG